MRSFEDPDTVYAQGYSGRDANGHSVTFFVISHGKDWVAFDTGNNAMVAKDPVGYW